MDNPNEPRKFIRPGAIEAVRDSLLAIGQQTPAKDRPLIEAPERLPDWEL